MKREKEDRRVRLTKLAIRESLLELMQTLPISKISVTMICAAADINRSTFYAHYTDQYDLLTSMQQQAVLGIKNHIFATSFTGQAENAAPIIVKVLEYAKADQALFKVLLGENGDASFKNKLMFLAQEKTLAEIREDQRLDEETAKYLELFAISGLLSIIRSWLEGGCVDEPGKLAALMTKLLYQGIFGFYQ